MDYSAIDNGVFNEGTVYLNQVIKHLIELNNFPDIKIKYFLYDFGSSRRVRAELILCTGEIYASELVVDARFLKDLDFKERVENDLLKDVSYKYLKRAYEERKNGKVKAEAPNFLRSCQKMKGE